MPLSPNVLFQTLPGPHGNIGLITLNRPDQLNALDESMCVAVRAQLSEWAKLAAIKAVVICGAGEKAFCAGGDIRAIYTSRDQPEIARSFFAHEYRLNQDIYHFPKPYIAFMHGLTMGGGVGLSVNGKYRIATEKLKLAMPETGIGFFTDVGGSYFLSRCPGRMGYYLGLTGTVINAADAQQIGLIDKVLNSADMPVLLDALIQADWSKNADHIITQIVGTFTPPVVATDLVTHNAIIDRCFSRPSVEAIIAALEEETDTWSQQIAQLLRTRSPTSLKVVLAQLNRGALLDFDACMQMEYHIANHFLTTSDFYEGIRAAVIDKDHSPHWQPASLEEVKGSNIENYFPR